MAETFNLIDEPWIEVIDHNGQESEISLYSLLSDAENYRGLSSDLGTVNFAILRVILAVIYRSWDSPKWRNLDDALDHWESKWNQSSLLDQEIEKYLVDWSHRFDLRDSKTPFFQVPDLHTSKNEWKTVDLLLPDVGDEGALFTMRSEVDSLSAPEAARMVIHCLAYDYSGIKSGAVGDDRVKGGRGYPIGIGWAGWLGGTVLEGDSLRETLLLNYTPHRDQAGKSDLPLWELPQLSAARRMEAVYNNDENPERNGTTGQVELLTWPQRRVRLRWENTKVIGVLISNGDRVGYVTKQGIETMTPWRFSEPQSKKAKTAIFMPRSLDSGRAMWRSIGGILPNQSSAKVKSKFSEGSDEFLTSTTVIWVGRLVSDDVISRDKVIRLRMVSMVYGAQSSSFSGIVEDSLTVKSPLLAVDGEGLRAAARSAVAQTDDAAMLLGTFYRNIIFAVSGETQVDTMEIRNQFFSAVDTRFRRWLTELPEVADPQEALLLWGRELAPLARQLASEVVSAQGPAVWVGRWNDDRGLRITAANAMAWMNRGLRALLEPVDQGAPENDGSIEK